MLSRAFRFTVFCLALLGMGLLARAGITADTPYTERGKTDFDTLLQILNPYGTWSKIDGNWAFTPRDHQVPYTNGRWIYTEYGWCWKGNQPHSWATEHYGYWKCGTNKVWSWYPGAFWLPQIVEIRATSSYIGWRCAEVDDDGNFVEAPIDRYAKEDEWTFVTLAQFANPITPGLVAPPDVVKTQLEDSTDSRHIYLTYRPIARPGPHPADFVNLCQDGKMFAPKTVQDQMTVSSAPSLVTILAGTNVPATNAAGVVPPQLVDADSGLPVDQRKVKYWITMSLPTYWTQPPADGNSEQIFFYRPDMYQDQDGIERRITLWFNPHARVKLSELLAGQTPDAKAQALSGPTSASAGTPAVPAAPEIEQENNPFVSPLDENFHPSDVARSASASSKNPAPSGTNVAPSGLATPAPPQ